MRFVVVSWSCYGENRRVDISFRLCEKRLEDAADKGYQCGGCDEGLSRVL